MSVTVRSFPWMSTDPEDRVTVSVILRQESKAGEQMARNKGEEEKWGVEGGEDGGG